MAVSTSKNDAGSVSSEKPVLETLMLPGGHDLVGSDEDSSIMLIPCVLCEEQENTCESLQGYLKHLLLTHKLVIADVNLIADFKSYCKYWKERFKQLPLNEFCAEIQTTTTIDDERYYLLSDVLPEDKQLRELLQKRKLEFVLASQQEEREDENFSRDCLFCREHFNGNRSLMFNHMSVEHGFNVGQPDNLVFTNEFLNLLEEKLNNLQCLYCEKTFRDKTILKEHMRKKQHRKINPKNHSYDKFYVINYLELGKNWEKIQKERDIIEVDTEETESEDEWSGWEEESSGQAVCLFCEFSSSNADKLRLHMLELHDFDLHEIKTRLNLTYYQQVKLVNYIRRQVHLCVCIGCGEKFDCRSRLFDHLHEASHTNTVPDIEVWDQPQYYFPTYENDNLLCQLDDEDDVIGNHGNETVIAEDTPVIDTILSEESIRQEIFTS